MDARVFIVLCAVCMIVIVKSAVSRELRQSIRAFIINSVAIDSGVPCPLLLLLAFFAKVCWAFCDTRVGRVQCATTNP